MLLFNWHMVAKLIIFRLPDWHNLCLFHCTEMNRTIAKRRIIMMHTGFYKVSEVRMKRKFGSIMLGILLAAVLAGSAIASPVHLPAIKDVGGTPGRIAVDSLGNIYVSEPALNMVRIYDTKGRLSKTLSVPGPFALAVDKNDLVYVGSEKNKVVKVYKKDLTFDHNLGSGNGEFQRPNDISIDENNRAYVVDSLKNIVAIYDASGAFVSSFGGPGDSNGFFQTPTSVAINDATDEVYVSDSPVLGDGASGARIQVFDKSGVFLRSFGQYGNAVGQITSIVDIAVDGRTGTLYLLDIYQNAALISDAVSGRITNALYDLTPGRQTITPQGIAISKNGIAYITSSNGRKIELYGLDGYVTDASQ